MHLVSSALVGAFLLASAASAQVVTPAAPTASIVTAPAGNVLRAGTNFVEDQ